jgi:hypothetical protein
METRYIVQVKFFYDPKRWESWTTFTSSDKDALRKATNLKNQWKARLYKSRVVEETIARRVVSR